MILVFKLNFLIWIFLSSSVKFTELLQLSLDLQHIKSLEDELLDVIVKHTVYLVAVLEEVQRSDRIFNAVKSYCLNEAH